MSFTSYYVESWWERFKLRLLIWAFILFCISAYTSYKEMKYLLIGHKATGVVTDLRERSHISRYGTKSSHLAVTYRFTEAGGRDRVETQSVSTDTDEDFGPGATVTVQYLSGGGGDSRLAGHTKAWLTVPFIACSVFLTFISVRFWREYTEHERSMARDRDLT